MRIRALKIADRRFLTGLISILVSIALTSNAAIRPPGNEQVSGPGIEELARNLPLHFIENVGQADERVAFYVHGLKTSLFLTQEGLVLRLSDPEEPSPDAWVVRQDFVGARSVLPRGQDQTNTTISYFRGPKSQWKTGLKTYNQVTYEDLWPGIDLSYFGHVNELKHSFVVRPGADPTKIRIRLRGATKTAVAGNGSLVTTTPLGEIIDATPFVYQMIDGSRVEIPAEYDLTVGSDSTDIEYGFILGEYDSDSELIVDPATIVYCGFVGGSTTEQGYGIAVDDSGSAYIAGVSYSSETTFPVEVGPDTTYGGSGDAFVAKLTADGTDLMWAGYVGGANSDTAKDIAVDTFGNVYITGYTEGGSFPTKVGPDLWHNGLPWDAFVTKILSDGSDLVYSGYIGGTNRDYGEAIAVDGSGSAYIVGRVHSSSANFPVSAGGFDPTFNGGTYDAWVAKVSVDGSSLEYAGYIGGDQLDGAHAVAVDTTGSAYVAGYTRSGEATFPELVGPDLTYNGGKDAFIAKVSADGSQLDYAGYIGGAADDHAYGVDVDTAGAAYVVGYTASDESTFPESIGPDLTHNGSWDAFIVKVKDDGTALDYGGFIGGSSTEIALRVAVDSFGNAYLVGPTQSQADFPVIDGPGGSFNGGTDDGFIARVRNDGAVLDYAGFIGGSGGFYEYARGVAVDDSGDAYVVGETYSNQGSFPVSIGPDLEHNGGSDAYVAKVTFCGNSTTLTEDTWSLISLPCDPDSSSNTVADIFGDDGLGAYGTDWAMLERDEVGDTYVLLDETDTLAQGAGYWIKVLVGDHTLDETGDRTDTSSDFHIGLIDAPSPGRWNMVGHPHTFPVSWGDVKVMDGDPPNTVYSLSEAAAGSFIEGRWMYKYNGSAYQTYHPDVGSPTLDLFDGFWVRALDSATLLIPSSEATERAVDVDHSDRWWIRLGVTGDGLDDPENYLGRMQSASDGEGEYDLPELEPFAAPFLTAVFPHPGWSGDRWAYTADFRHRRPGAGGQWDLEIRSDQSREITLTWMLDGVEPDILDRSILVDLESGTEVRPATASSYSTSMVSGTHRFVWRVNSLPQVNAGPDRIAGAGQPLAIVASFHDEDPADNHTSAIDWGDGTVDHGVAADGTIEAIHTYESAGDYSVVVCVEDQLEGHGCDGMDATVFEVLFADDFESGTTAAWSGE